MYFLIQNAPIRWPDAQKHGISVSDQAKDIISKMLDKDRTKRLGNKNDLDDILGHPWFADLDIKKLLEKKIEPPYVPKVTSPTDIKNFDASVT